MVEVKGNCVTFIPPKEELEPGGLSSEPTAPQSLEAVL